MKKLLLVLAIGTFAVACNNSTDSSAKPADTTAAPTVDTTTKPVDTTAKPATDTTKAKADSAAKK